PRSIYRHGPPPRIARRSTSRGARRSCAPFFLRMTTPDHPPADPRRLVHLCPLFERRRGQSSMHACGLRLQACDEIARSLPGQALMIEAHPVKPAQLLPSSSAARSAVIALGHDDAVPGMGGRDRGIDGENAAMARSNVAHDADEKILVLAVDRSDQRASSAPDPPGGILLIAIGHDGRSRPEHLD